MFIHDDYDDSYDIRQLQRLPIYQGMTEREIRHVVTKMAVAERLLWEEETRARLRTERVATLAKIEADDMKALPPEPVKIAFGVKIFPSLIDDQGFVSHDDLGRQKRTIKLSQDEKRKIYL